MEIVRTELQLKVGDRQVSAYLAAPPQGGPGVLVLHAWWGLSLFFKQVCDRLAGQGFTALAPDLRGGETAQTIEEAMALMKKEDSQLMGEIVQSAIGYIQASPAKHGSKIGVLGFSMGGAWTLVAATTYPDQFTAAVVFYGSGYGDFKKMKARFLGHFSEVDEWEPIDEIRGMEAAMKSAGVDTTFHTYPGTAHWFMEDNRPEYNRKMAELAWERTYKFLNENIK